MAEFEPLDPIDVRVLGALMEKELTTPDNYPLTLNALTAACNQSSSRDPVMSLDGSEVSPSLERLAERSFARGIHRSDARVMRYRQEIGETLHLHRPERAVLSVLMLRGPQTAGEIRTRTARAAEFVDPSHVEITLDALATLSTPLVVALPRQIGQKEARYTHLLAGPPSLDDAPTEVPATAPGGSHGRSSTDRIAALEDEVAALRDEVTDLRAQLDAFRQQFE